ncbi:MAG: TlpA family protein disulfide reductase [Chloroflexi bacterium]|nr:TlpA family protein disulfide reductase [Chloroflexota bacterium]
MHPPTKFSLQDANGQEMQFPPQGPVLLALVKEDCDTCNLTLPLLEAVHRATDDGLDVWVAVQKTEDIPVLKDRHDLTMPLLDDDALDLSYETDIDTVPTLFLYDQEQNCTLQTFGFDRHEWREIAKESMALAGRPDGNTDIDWDALPVQRPGCGARNYEPGVYERLQAIKSGDLLSRLVDLASSDDIHDFMYEQGYTDGFPVVPPTRERVWKMLQGTDRDPQDEVAIVPPNLAPITVEKIAINAVMAGAKPEYMPSIIALVEIACTDSFNIHGVLATTMGATPVGIFNGPIRDRIGMNYLHGALGSGNRANAAIGRALRLCVRNVGGSVPGGTDRATQGGPHRLTMNFAENEDASPWESLAVEYGFEPADDVATLMAMSGGPATIADERSREARGMAGTLAMSMSCMQDPKSPMVDTLVVLSPDHAGIFGRSGWSKDDVRECIMEETAIPLKHRLRSDDAGCGLPQSVVERFGGEAALDLPVPKFREKSNIILVVAGSSAAKFSTILGGWAGGAYSVPTSATIGPTGALEVRGSRGSDMDKRSSGGRELGAFEPSVRPD